MSTAKPKIECKRCHGAGFLNWSSEEYETVCSDCNGEGKVEMELTPIFEVFLEPKNPESPIKRMVLRVDSPGKYYDLDTVLTYIEEKFPDWKAGHVISGFKQVDTVQ